MENCPVNGFSREGLSTIEVNQKRLIFGYNEAKQKRELFFVRLANKFMGITPWLLEVTAAIAVILGNYTGAALVVVLLVTNAIIAFVQEKRASDAVEALKQKISIECRVLRDGKWVTLPARELVPGDVIRLRSGDIVPADVETFEGTLSVDQSALTGESRSAKKPPGSEVYSGSIIKRGEATAFVTKTGQRTYYGKTVQLVSTSKPKLHVDRIIEKFTWALLVTVSALVAASFVVAAVIGLNLLQIVPLMLVLLSSGVPVALATMFSVSLALGSRTLAEKGLVVTRLNATEDAAEMTVLCLDKTGTITENKLSVAEIIEATSLSKKSKKYQKTDVLIYAALCSKKENNDPLDLAILNELNKLNLTSAVEVYNVSNFLPFDPVLRRTEVIAVHKEKNIMRKVIKGQLGVVLDMCRLPPQERQKWFEYAEHFATRDYRTIAVAISERLSEEQHLLHPSDSQQNEFLASNIIYHLVGLIALADRPREDSKEIIQELKSLGISVKMLTGDTLTIAQEIAKEIGLGTRIITLPKSNQADEKSESLSMSSMSMSMSTSEFYSAKDQDRSTDDVKIQIGVPIDEVDGFAEIYPEDKYNIVKQLQKRGHIVGMTGDGVNDAPALKQAEVGIAVKNATDMAKGAASAVLTGEGLHAILELVKVGRQIHQRVVTDIMNKIVKTMQQVVFIVVMFFLYQIFIIDSTKMVLLLLLVDFVMVSLATDRSQVSPYPETWPVVKFIAIGVLLGLVVVSESLALEIIAITVYGWGNDIESLRTFTFEILFFFGMGTLFSVRERHWFWKTRPSWPLLIAVIVDAVVVIVVCSTGVPFLSVKAVPWWATVTVIGWAFVLILFVNDFIKVLLFTLILSDRKSVV